VPIAVGVRLLHPDFLNTAASVRSAIPTTARLEVMPFQK
jgi:hypothetical protein